MVTAFWPYCRLTCILLVAIQFKVSLFNINFCNKLTHSSKHNYLPVKGLIIPLGRPEYSNLEIKSEPAFTFRVSGVSDQL